MTIITPEVGCTLIDSLVAENALWHPHAKVKYYNLTILWKMRQSICQYTSKNVL